MTFFFAFFHRHLSSSSPASSQTPFLCELKRFLRAALPQEHPESPLLQLDSLQSLPPLSLGPASSEAFLAEMINSSAPIIFSFSSWGSMYPVSHGELSLSSALLEELRQRLEQYVGQIMQIIREEDLPRRATERLEKLKELSSLQRTDQVAGDVEENRLIKSSFSQMQQEANKTCRPHSAQYIL